MTLEKYNYFDPNFDNPNRDEEREKDPRSYVPIKLNPVDISDLCKAVGTLLQVTHDKHDPRNNDEMVHLTDLRVRLEHAMWVYRGLPPEQDSEWMKREEERQQYKREHAVAV